MKQNQNYIDLQDLLNQNLSLYKTLQINLVEEDLNNLSYALKNCSQLSALSLLIGIYNKNQNNSYNNLILICGAIEQFNDLQYLDLQFSYGNNLSDEEISKLSLAISKFANLQTFVLVFSSQLITEKSFYTLTCALGLCSNLQNLELQISGSTNLAFNQHGLISGLEKCNNLKDLKFSLSLFSLNKEFVYDICSSLSKCDNLQNLYLKFMGCDLNDDSVSGLELLGNCPNIVGLELNLRNNNICGLSEFGLKSALAKYVNLQKFSLILDLNPINDEGLSNLSTAFSQITKIRSLKIIKSCQVVQNYLPQVFIQQQIVLLTKGHHIQVPSLQNQKISQIQGFSYISAILKMQEYQILQLVYKSVIIFKLQSYQHITEMQPCKRNKIQSLKLRKQKDQSKLNNILDKFNKSIIYLYSQQKYLNLQNIIQIIFIKLISIQQLIIFLENFQINLLFQKYLVILSLGYIIIQFIHKNSQNVHKSYQICNKLNSSIMLIKLTNYNINMQILTKQINEINQLFILKMKINLNKKKL
ncbi:hypothetical protein TTHERM_00758960 (macronuclear) [Tetrahymena thermophila SB210]|uniref:Uncharacterized protein n=1 Tax=Tetrahymena thermophila (strain SB210) TaxID=312017 RepID=Q23JK9_TETTS|nr:hypothetical protein TTHERM_00758960 [Tetrahymena thermophila SB210]EAR96734.2 hypothetical protein TTHERM_00758960 [Tetrahymena thermophila SB210]|eukprot:XP_001016979.2 hypothetical protein TTHERM_00758960 [Tetrahymena thermophila SB210]